MSRTPLRGEWIGKDGYGKIAPECGKGKVSEPECSIWMDQKKKKKEVTVRWIGQRGRSAQKKKKRWYSRSAKKKKKVV